MFHFWGAGSEGWSGVEKGGPDRYRLNDFSGNTARGSSVRSGTSSLSLLLKEQGLGQPWAS